MENAPHLTQGQSPDLARAIARTHLGQAGWAGWHAPNEVCGDCRFFDRGNEVWGVLKGPCLKRRDLDPKRKKGRRYRLHAERVASGRVEHDRHLLRPRP
jgi:hypothetical protein